MRMAALNFIIHNNHNSSDEGRILFKGSRIPSQPDLSWNLSCSAMKDVPGALFVYLAEVVKFPAQLVQSFTDRLEKGGGSAFHPNKLQGESFERLGKHGLGLSLRDQKLILWKKNNLIKTRKIGRHIYGTGLRPFQTMCSWAPFTG